MPTKDVLKKTKKAALEWANKIREIDGKKPLRYLPRGKRKRVTMCPLANATGYHICGRTKQPPIAHSANVAEFISWFDMGLYPELVEKKNNDTN